MSLPWTPTLPTLGRIPRDLPQYLVFGGGVFLAELLQVYFSNHFGWALGGLMAGLVLVTFSPLQHLMERRLTRRLPTRAALVRLTRQERDAFYIGQVRAAWADHRLTLAERAVLNRLRDRLGLSDEEARTLEHEGFEDP